MDDTDPTKNQNDHGGGVTTLQTLEISGMRIREEELEILLDAVGSNTTLSTFRVSSGLRSDSACVVANVVKRNRHLKVLEFSDIQCRRWFRDTEKREFFEKKSRSARAEIQY